LNYVQLLEKKFGAIGFDAKFIIDTGRNGVTDMRDQCSNWCNIRDAGVGHFPTTNTGHD